MRDEEEECGRDSDPDPLRLAEALPDSLAQVLNLLMQKQRWHTEQETEDGHPAQRDTHGYDIWPAHGLEHEKTKERSSVLIPHPVIDAILEADKTAPPKQRHTAKRIFDRLRIEQGYAGGYTVVKDYVRIARTRSREAFVPLAQANQSAGLIPC